MSVTTETDQAPAVVESSTDQQQQPTSNDGTSNIMVKLITGISFPNSRRRKSSDISDDTSTASSSATHPEKRSKYCPFPKSTTDYLHDWLINHTDYPFPNADEKEAMAAKTGLNRKQLNDWFTKARKKMEQKMPGTLNLKYDESLQPAQNISGNSSSGGLSVPAKMYSGGLSVPAKMYLLKWYQEHESHPFPTKIEKQTMLTDLGLEQDDLKKIEGWLSRHRSRNKREEMKQVEETKQVTVLNFKKKTSDASSLDAPTTTQVDTYLYQWLGRPENAGNFSPRHKVRKVMEEESGIDERRIESWFYRLRKRMKKQAEAEGVTLEVLQNALMNVVRKDGFKEEETKKPTQDQLTKPAVTGPEVSTTSKLQVTTSPEVLTAVMAPRIVSPNESVQDSSASTISDDTIESDYTPSTKQVDAYLYSWLASPENVGNFSPGIIIRRKIEEDSGIKEGRIEKWFYRLRRKMKKQAEDGNVPLEVVQKALVSLVRGYGCEKVSNMADFNSSILAGSNVLIDMAKQTVSPTEISSPHEVSDSHTSENDEATTQGDASFSSILMSRCVSPPLFQFYEAEKMESVVKSCKLSHDPFETWS